MAKNLNMTQGRPMGLLFAFALPLMFGNVFQQLYTVVDTAIVGKGVGMDALAALGTVDWLNWMMLGIVQGYTQGFSVRISQKFGEGNMPALKRIIGQSARVSIFLALIITAVGQMGLPLFLHLLRVPADLRGMAELYTRILMAGLPAVTFYNYCAAVLRAVGDSRTPLKAMSVAAVTNIVLDLVAVFVLGWGIAGAAAATVFSQLVSGVLCFAKIYKTPELHISREYLRPEKKLRNMLIRMGTPVAAKNTIMSMGGMIVQSVVNGFSMSFIAGFTATGKLYGLLEIAAVSYGYAVMTYVGQNYGAGQDERIRKGMHAAELLSVLTALGIAAVMVLFGRDFTMLFISAETPELIDAAVDVGYGYLCVMSAFLPVLYLLYIYQSALQAMGNTMSSMVSGIIELAVRTSVAAGVGILGSEYGIFAAAVSAWCGDTLYLAISYYRTLRKKHHDI